MKIALIQTDPAWEAPGANLARAEEWVREADADLVVLPEMFPTGFTMNAAAAADTMDGKGPQAMREMAARHGKAVMGSMAIAEGGRFFNRMFFATPDGGLKYYDKRHLFRMSGENGIYTPGRERPVWEYMGVRMLPLVCYDLRFPVWIRNRGDYDMIVTAAAWPAPRAAVWRTLLRARAIENLCYVAGVNRTGDDPNTSYDGDTALIDFMGNPVAEATGRGEQMVSGTIDMAAQRAFREKFPAWMDADDFTLEM